MTDQRYQFRFGMDGNLDTPTTREEIAETMARHIAKVVVEQPLRKVLVCDTYVPDDRAMGVICRSCGKNRLDHPNVTR